MIGLCWSRQKLSCLPFANSFQRKIKNKVCRFVVYVGGAAVFFPVDEKIGYNVETKMEK